MFNTSETSDNNNIKLISIFVLVVIAIIFLTMILSGGCMMEGFLSPQYEGMDEEIDDDDTTLNEGNTIFEENFSNVEFYDNKKYWNWERIYQDKNTKAISVAEISPLHIEVLGNDGVLRYIDSRKGRNLHIHDELRHIVKFKYISSFPMYKNRLSIVGVTTNGAPFFYNWSKKPSEQPFPQKLLTTAAAPGPGGMAFTTEKHEIWSAGGPGGMKKLPGLLTQITFTKSAVYGVNKHDSIYKWDIKNRRWIRLPGALRQIAGDPHGELVAGVNKHGHLYTWYRNRWNYITSGIKQVCVFKTRLFVLRKDNAIYAATWDPKNMRPKFGRRPRPRSYFRFSGSSSTKIYFAESQMKQIIPSDGDEVEISGGGKLNSGVIKQKQEAPPEKPRNIALKTCGNRWIAGESNRYAVGNRTRIGAWERFTLYDLTSNRGLYSNDLIRIRGQYGFFSEYRNRLRLYSTTQRTSTFMIKKVGGSGGNLIKSGDTVAIYNTTNRKYMSALYCTRQINVNGPRIGTWERFRIYFV